MDKVVNFFYKGEFKFEGKRRVLKPHLLKYWYSFWIISFFTFLWTIFFPIWDKVINFLNYVIWG